MMEWNMFICRGCRADGEACREELPTSPTFAISRSQRVILPVAATTSMHLLWAWSKAGL